MCLSRAEEVEGICIVKRYAPNLFRNGDLLGPDLLLKFQRGDINETQNGSSLENRVQKGAKAEQLVLHE